MKTGPGRSPLPAELYCQDQEALVCTGRPWKSFSWGLLCARDAQRESGCLGLYAQHSQKNHGPPPPATLRHRVAQGWILAPGAWCISPASGSPRTNELETRSLAAVGRDTPHVCNGNLSRYPVSACGGVRAVEGVASGCRPRAAFLTQALLYPCVNPCTSVSRAPGNPGASVSLWSTRSPLPHGHGQPRGLAGLSVLPGTPPRAVGSEEPAEGATCPSLPPFPCCAPIYYALLIQLILRCINEPFPPGTAAVSWPGEPGGQRRAPAPRPAAPLSAARGRRRARDERETRGPSRPP